MSCYDIKKREIGIMRYFLLLCLLFAMPVFADESTLPQAPAPIQAASAITPSDPLRYTNGPVDLKIALELGIQGVTGTHAFWGLAQTFSPASNYPERHYWMESYIKPGLTVSYKTSNAFTAYGGVALLGSGTLGEDYFAQKNDGRVLLENAYLGLRWKDASGNFSVDVSGGQQPYVLGNRLLISDGAGNGFERGCLTLGPRTAWAMTGIGRFSWKQISLEGFYLDPNELESSDSHTELVGANLKWEPVPSQYAGVAFIKAVTSQAPYPKAPVAIINNGRDGLEVYDVYWNYAPMQGTMAGFSFMGEAVLERNSRINMEAWAAAADIGYRFLALPFAPRLSYSPRYFSGDDPGTPGKLERFDSLFGHTTPDMWSSGSSGSFGFLNSNLFVHRFRLDLVLSPQDFMNLNYWYVEAAKTNSPIQFGQGARLSIVNGSPVVISGVPSRELSHDVYFEYTHMFNSHVFLTAGVGGSFPGKGLRDVIYTGAHDWWGGLINIIVKY